MAKFKRRNVVAKVKKEKRPYKKRAKKEIPVKKETPKEPEVKKPVVAPAVAPEPKPGFCACGEPVATELGQTAVCKNHIRAN